ncbi:helix-turn-helix domain-containing protein [Candidatus Saccharibacteria bacterium]|nr:helix-turn-helix domain-containing protein [Candidatus Saccharibacteria bacterium]
MNNLVSGESDWQKTAESIAWQHNSELKCAMQLVVEPDEEIEITEVRKRIIAMTDGALEVSIPTSPELRKSFRQCFVPNNTYQLLGKKRDVIRKVPDTYNDALAGHHLQLSAVVGFSLTNLLGRTNIAGGKRRAPVFAMGILREQANQREPLSQAELARRLDTSRSTVFQHVHNLGNIGVLSQLEQHDLTTSRIVLSPKYAYVIKRLINAVEGVSNCDEIAQDEGLLRGLDAVGNPDMFTFLLSKRLHT